MTNHRTGTRDEWLDARLDLLKAEKELHPPQRRALEQRQELPWSASTRTTASTPRTGGDARGSVPRPFAAHRVPLHVRARVRAGARLLGVADGFDGSSCTSRTTTSGSWPCRGRRSTPSGVQAPHGLDLSVGLVVGSDFNFDFNVSFTEEQQRANEVEYNYRPMDTTPILESPSEGLTEIAAMTGTDAAGYTRQAPGISAFALEEGAVYHTYSAFQRGSGFALGHVPVARPRAQGARPVPASGCAGATSTAARNHVHCRQKSLFHGVQSVHL